MKYYVVVFGCQMNISDAERVASVLESAKYEKTANINEADLIAITMCSIRQSAVDRVHGLVEKFETLRKKNPKLKTILTGCMLKKDKKIFVEGFDYVIDIREIQKIPELIAQKSNFSGHASPASTGSLNPRRATPLRGDQASTPAGVLQNLFSRSYLDIVPKYENQFSASVPIMTGCNNFCAYCVVPYTREREISRTAKEIITEIKNLVKKEYKEIWLLGQNVNSYSNVLKNNRIVNFPELLKLINNIPGDFWIRFTSSHPKDFSDELADAMAKYKKVTPYLNLPVQSGDDKVLKTMNRHYTIKDYKNKLKKLKEKIPDIAISTDIIVGFPGETKKQFENTAKLFRDVKYDMAYINKYSARAGTLAAKRKDNVSTEEKKRREKVLTDILKQTALSHNKKYLGREVFVLFNENRKDTYFGKEEHYKTIKVKSQKNILGKLVKVKITEVSPFTLTGKIINAK